MACSKAIAGFIRFIDAIDKQNASSSYAATEISMLTATGMVQLATGAQKCTVFSPAAGHKQSVLP